MQRLRRFLVREDSRFDALVRLHRAKGTGQTAYFFATHLMPGVFVTLGQIPEIEPTPT